MKKLEKYFSRHIYLNSLSHLLAGVGIGILLTNSFFNPHPLRFGIAFLILGLLGHAYAYISK